MDMEIYQQFRGVFKTLSNIYDGTSPCKKFISRVDVNKCAGDFCAVLFAKIVNDLKGYFYTIYLQQGPKYTSELSLSTVFIPDTEIYITKKV